MAREAPSEGLRAELKRAEFRLVWCTVSSPLRLVTLVNKAALSLHNEHNASLYSGKSPGIVLINEADELMFEPDISLGAASCTTDGPAWLLMPHFMKHDPCTTNSPLFFVTMNYCHQMHTCKKTTTHGCGPEIILTCWKTQ